MKLKIMKKQVEELLGRMDVQGLTLHQVLYHPINVDDRFDLASFSLYLFFIFLKKIFFLVNACRLQTASPFFFPFYIS